MEIRTVTLHRAAYKPADFPRDDRPQFAIVGRSNVGKSSLLNTLVGRRDVARVSQTPGKTQGIHFYLLNEKIYMVDLPGYGYARVPYAIRSAWEDLIRTFFETSRTLRVMYVLLDARRVPSPEDQMLLDWASAAHLRTRIVLTKIDKLSNQQLAKSRQGIGKQLNFDPSECIGFSKVTKQGKDEMWRDIDRQLQQRAHPSVR